MTNELKFDLEERTAKFGEEIIRFAKDMPKNEAREAKHFLRMSAIAVEEMAERARKLWREARELNLILNAIYKKL